MRTNYVQGNNHKVAGTQENKKVFRVITLNPWIEFAAVAGENVVDAARNFKEAQYEQGKRRVCGWIVDEDGVEYRLSQFSRK